MLREDYSICIRCHKISTRTNRQHNIDFFLAGKCVVSIITWFLFVCCFVVAVSLLVLPLFTVLQHFRLDGL